VLQSEGDFMINEERVTEMYHMAVYDQKENRQARQMNSFFRRDYIGKELIKSIFSGSIAFVLIVVFLLLGTAEDVIDNLSSMDLVSTGTVLVILYLLFEFLYLLITMWVYRRRYREGRVQLKKYYKHLKSVNRMYTREEKLKV
jgi:uncharacterized membrane protein YdbT with pleckstrin-like domain